MPYRKVQFVNGEYYHVINRGVDGRDIYVNEIDYRRFLECLEVFNNPERMSIFQARRSKRHPMSQEERHRVSHQSHHEKLVEILCYCLIPNHFHLLLKQLADNGVVLFMQKLGNGYTKYFNLTHDRYGHIFQGPFKAVHIKNDAQFLHISRYIHLNVLDLLFPQWREGKLDDWDKAKKFLEDYPWSSYPIFIGKRQSDFCSPELLGEIFKTPQKYENFIREWTERSLSEVEDLILE
jgi:putative transposase